MARKRTDPSRSVLGNSPALTLGGRTTGLGAWILLHLATAAVAQPPEENIRCLNCHGNERIVRATPAERATMVRPMEGVSPRVHGTDLYIDRALYDTSVHRQTTCVACHPDCDELPHAIQPAPAQCTPCHTLQVQEHAGSVHGQAIAGGDVQAAHCRDCHGTHDIISAKNPQSRTYKLQLPFTCAKCHTNAQLMAKTHVREPLAAKQYIESMHGRGLIAQGLIIAPSCNDCHGVHNIWPVTDPRSKIYRDNIPATCGTCHIGVERTYDEGIHGRLLATGDKRAPVCSTCHTAHDIVRPEGVAFKLASDGRCGACHADRLARYRETFHGKAMALGLPGVAACYDCHGQHDILPVSDPRSHLSTENRLRTCRKCHPRASQKFTAYIAHADHSDRRHYPALYWSFLFMTTIVVGTFAFFGVHTILWFSRSAVLYFRDPRAFREMKLRAFKDDVVYVRFRPFERFLHILVVFSFLLLVATGMPLKFYYTGWAQWMVSLFGGLEVTTVLHRVGAIVTFTYMGLHILSMGRRIVRYRDRFRDPLTRRYSLRQLLHVAFGPDIPVPNVQDFRDWWAHQKWFFGRGPRPQFDRWTYWEKFDYMAVFWGVAVIGLSGLIMWFPVEFTRVLPGWVINVALIIHSDEALLAAGFIFTFHFFNVHFRLEKFPMDTVIFSGRIARSEMLHERKRWYERLAAAGRLGDIRLRDEWAQWKRVVHPLGFLAFGIGVVLLILIFFAMGSRMLSNH
jgi:cytochrome b subunit of formate dehydrogenase